MLGTSPIRHPHHPLVQRGELRRVQLVKPEPFEVFGVQVVDQGDGFGCVVLQVALLVPLHISRIKPNLVTAVVVLAWSLGMGEAVLVEQPCQIGTQLFIKEHTLHILFRSRGRHGSVDKLVLGDEMNVVLGDGVVHNVVLIHKVTEALEQPLRLRNDVLLVGCFICWVFVNPKAFRIGLAMGDAF